MSLGTILYNLFIEPLELLFEVIFSIANRLTGNPGLSIIVLSLAINILVLPLYKRADQMQAESRDTEARLQPGVAHIKKTFKGDERFMILQTYYRQNQYKPTDILNGSVSLLLQIPFFMAAYNYLSELQMLRGFSFGPIMDMGAPDGMIKFGSLAINFLPIFMTLLNLVAGAIYTKGSPLKTKIQLYGMAGLFLVLLYDSPAGLVFYWTLNNLFSLIKTVFYKLKNPKLAASYLCSLSSILLIIGVCTVWRLPSMRHTFLLVLFLMLFQLPLIVYFLQKNETNAVVAPVT